jgi:radical SAM protein with 4Fe4S-binding SPASM domain
LKEKNFNKQFMDFELYKKAIDDMALFGNKIKALIFAGHGEPLLHKDIAKMVAYAKKKNVAERVEIVTNGSLLTEELADALIEAGLDRLRISIQGINSEQYRDIMGKKFNFQALINNIKYFNKNKINTEVYCKIIDIALASAAEETKFKDIFRPIADEVAIEYAIPFVQEIDLSEQKESFECSKQGNVLVRAEICSMPFYMLVVTPNGDIVPCCSTDVPVVYGNLKQSSLFDIWHNEKIQNFYRLHLLGKRKKHVICSGCSVQEYGLQSGDYLDEKADELLVKYEAEWSNKNEVRN